MTVQLHDIISQLYVCEMTAFNKVLLVLTSKLPTCGKPTHGIVSIWKTQESLGLVTINTSAYTIFHHPDMDSNNSLNLQLLAGNYEG